MLPSRRKFAFLLFASLLSSCASVEEHARERNDKLRALYPPAITNRAAVEERLKPLQPHVSEVRPNSGWTDSHNPALAERALAAERRTRKQVDVVDVYLAPDDLFSLCYCLFYYDGASRVVDAEWQYASD